MCINIHTHTNEEELSMDICQEARILQSLTWPLVLNHQMTGNSARRAGMRTGLETGMEAQVWLYSWLVCDPRQANPTEPQFPWWRSRENNIYLRRLEWELKWKKPNAHFLPFFLREGGKPVPPSALGQAPWSPKRLAHNEGRFHDVPRAVRSGPSKATHVLWDTFLN